MSSVPYVLAPPWAHRTLYALRLGAYGASLTAGVGALVLTPTSIADALSTALTDAWGGIAIVGSLLALYGATRERYRWELAGLPLVAAAMLVYAYTVWTIVPDVPTRLAQAGTISLTFLMLAIRSIDLVLVLLRALREHRDQEVLTAARAAIARAEGDGPHEPVE